MGTGTKATHLARGNEPASHVEDLDPGGSTIGQAECDAQRLLRRVRDQAPERKLRLASRLHASDIPDRKRADAWIEELRDFVRKGDMPALSLMYLPRDHTVGGAAGQAGRSRR